MKSNVYRMLGPKNLKMEEEEIDINSISPTDIVGKTIVSIVSPGTEIAAYIGAPPLRPMKVYPRVNGYCNVAEVIAVGSEVKNIKLGDRVSTHQSHRSSFCCDASAVNNVLRRDDDAIAQATSYLWHLGYYPLLRANAKPGSNVLVIGLGALGLSAVASAALSGCNVIAISNRKFARNKAIILGAKSVYENKDISAMNKWSVDATFGVGVDLVITTSNSWKDWKTALEIVRDGGDIAIVGFPGRGLSSSEFNPLDSRYIYDKELTIFACGNPSSCDVTPRDIRFNLKRNYLFLGDMIRQNRLPALEIVTETINWRELDAVYQRMESRESELITVALDWTR